jgi:hypothetical protein
LRHVIRTLSSGFLISNVLTKFILLPELNVTGFTLGGFLQTGNSVVSHPLTYAERNRSQVLVRILTWDWNICWYCQHCFSVAHEKQTKLRGSIFSLGLNFNFRRKDFQALLLKWKWQVEDKYMRTHIWQNYNSNPVIWTELHYLL